MNFGRRLQEVLSDDLDPSERLEEIRERINTIGSEQIFRDYLLSQKRVFLTTLGDRDRLRALFARIPSNVLHGRALSTINSAFARDVGMSVEYSQPFCELFNNGLLGRVTTDSTTNQKRQEFKRPYEFNWDNGSIIGDSEIYLIHPCLHVAISDENPNYHLNPTNVIGDGRKWESNGSHRAFPMIFMSHSTANKAMVRPLIDRFESELNLLVPADIWFDERSIRVGGRIHREVEKGVENSDFVIVFVSRESLQSGWVDREWRAKHLDEISDGRIRVFTVLIDDTPPEELPSFLTAKKAIVLPDDDENRLRAMTVLAADVGAELRDHRSPV